MKYIIMEKEKYEDQVNEFMITSKIFKSDVVNLSESFKTIEDKQQELDLKLQNITMVKKVVMTIAEGILDKQKEVDAMGNEVESRNDTFIKEQNDLQAMKDQLTPINKLEMLKAMREL